jgi:deoxycytidine triphosphate deaminase
MYLVDSQIKELADKGKIKNISKDEIDSVSFDLHISNIISNEDMEITKELSPGETVIVECEEIIELDNDLVAIVIQKNSRLRSGLVINAPVYRPGHNTKIYISVTNASAKIIEIVSGQSIAAMMIEKLETTPDKPYSGTFQNEIQYKGLGNYKDLWEKHFKKANDKYESVKELEKGIYGTVITLMTIFIAIFSLINFEVGYILKSADNFMDLLLYNLIFVGGASLLICIINCILPNIGTTKKSKLFIVPAACFFVAIIVMLIN